MFFTTSAQGQAGSAQLRIEGAAAGEVRCPPRLGAEDAALQRSELVQTGTAHVVLVTSHTRKKSRAEAAGLQRSELARLPQTQRHG